MFHFPTIDQPGSGEFFLPETGCWFTFKSSTNQWGIRHGLPHEVDVLDGTRPANVLKTVAYVSVDEDENGLPVLEKWHLSRRKQFLPLPHA